MVSPRPVPVKRPSDLKRSATGLLAVDSAMAVASVGGGIAILSGFAELPNEWLADLPFDSFAIPGLVLALVVGGAWTFAATTHCLGSAFASIASIVAGVIQLGWFAVQFLLLGYVSWMQPVFAGVALIAIVLGLKLRKANQESIPQ